MIATHNSELLEYAHTQIRTHPELVREYYAGRTLLHSAAGKGSLETVNVLLAAGAEADATDGGRHTPLYSVANECHATTGPDIVRALVRAGGDVNAAGGVQRCTPLHMAARRGNGEIAEALLECGAALQPRDKRGDTPRKRALNCGKLKVAELLAARGARA